MKTRKKILRRVLILLIVVLAVLAAAFFIYTGQYYHAGKTAQLYMNGDAGIPVRMNNTSVKVKEESGAWLFDGPGTETAVVFYPGAKVQSESYAPVLYLIAQSGCDCFLVDMPFHLAFFGMNRAEKIMDAHPAYEHWYMSGHSLGGAMAGNFASEHAKQLDGVIFLAAYPTKSLDTGGMRVLSLYGSEDGVLNREHYRDSRSLMPDDFTEVVIKGGNHGQFGDYGRQKGDGKAGISAEEQWKQTAQAVDAFLGQE